VITTGSNEVAFALNETLVPNGALLCGENAIACEAAAPGCGVVTPVIWVEIFVVVDTSEEFPAYETVN
jgi:hypothetical protein